MSLPAFAARPIPLAAVAALLLLSACSKDGRGLLAAFGGAGSGQESGATSGDDPGDGAGGAPPAAQQAVLMPKLPIAAPDELIGRESAEVAELLGAPAFERRDGPAEVWQYRGKACILDVFLYKRQLGRLVEYAELRRRNGAEMSDQDCLTDLFVAKGGDAS